MLNQFKTLSTRLWFRAVLFAFAYYLAAFLSDGFSLSGASYPTLWFPSGLFAAVLILSALEDWPAYLLAVIPASLVYSTLNNQPVPDSVILSLCSILEAVTGAWLIRRFDQSAGEFSTATNVLYLLVFAAALGSMLNATIQTTLLVTLKNGVDFWSAWRIAFYAHGLGVLIITPIILSWAYASTTPIRKISPERLIEIAILATGLVVCSMYVFVGSFSVSKQSYMVIPFLVWVALRFGPRGISLGGLLVTLVSTWGTGQQLDGFAFSDMTIAPNMDTLGSFLAAALITCYILATVWEQGKRTEKALRDSEARYRMLIENQGEGVGIVNNNEVFTFANPAAAQIFGVDSLVGRNLREFTDLRQFTLTRQQTGLRRTGKKTAYELQIIQPGGKHCSLMVTASPEYGENGEWVGTFGVFHDITETKQTEMALRDSRARFQTLFDHSPIPIWEEDFSRVKRLLDGLRRDGVEDMQEFLQQHPEQMDACEQMVRILDANQAAIQQFNYSDKNEFMAQLSKMLQRGPRDIFQAELVAIADGKTEFHMEGPNDLVDGEVRYHDVRWTVAPGYEKDYRRVIVTIMDVTERRQAEEQMRYLSTHDVLTGLYNRNFFEAELERLQNSRLEPINVMVVDVNEMKITNDTFGHSAGDDLLRRTSQVLRMSFRKEDVIARIGGDEFVILFQGSLPIQDAVARVHECLAEHNHWYDGADLSLAIGASSGGKGSSLVELFKHADQQMYKEKGNSRKTASDNKIENKFGNPPQNN